MVKSAQEAVAKATWEGCDVAMHEPGGSVLVEVDPACPKSGRRPKTRCREYHHCRESQRGSMSRASGAAPTRWLSLRALDVRAPSAIMMACQLQRGAIASNRRNTSYEPVRIITIMLTCRNYQYFTTGTR
jgi:hypothetical protein